MDNLDDLAIKLPDYTEDMKKMFIQTSDFIRTLPLDNKQNDELIHYMVENVRRARQNGFICGLGVAMSESDITIVSTDKDQLS